MLRHEEIEKRVLIVRTREEPTDVELFLGMHRLLRRFLHYFAFGSGNLRELVEDLRAMLKNADARAEAIERTRKFNGVHDGDE